MNFVIQKLDLPNYLRNQCLLYFHNYKDKNSCLHSRTQKKSMLKQSKELFQNDRKQKNDFR